MSSWIDRFPRMSALLDNPVLQREIRSRFRRKRTFFTLTSKLILAAALVPILYFAINPRTSSNPAEESQSGLFTFTTLVMIEAALLLLLSPAMSCTSFTVEKEQRTFDLLVATRLTPTEIILGKLLASQYYVILLILGSAPIFILTIFFGGLSPNHVLGAILYLIFFSMAYGVIGLYFSLMTSKTALSVSLTYLSVLLINGGPLLAVVLCAQLLDTNPDTFALFSATSTTPFFPLSEILFVEVRKESFRELVVGGTAINIVFLTSLSFVLFLLMKRKLLSISDGKDE